MKKKVKQLENAIDYRRYYIDYLLTQIQDLLKELKEINSMSENLINEKIIKEKMNILYIGGKNNEK